MVAILGKSRVSGSCVASTLVKKEAEKWVFLRNRNQSVKGLFCRLGIYFCIFVLRVFKVRPLCSSLGHVGELLMVCVLEEIWWRANFGRAGQHEGTGVISTLVRLWKCYSKLAEK